jgi:hypothetical protein
MLSRRADRLHIVPLADPFAGVSFRAIGQLGPRSRRARRRGTLGRLPTMAGGSIAPHLSADIHDSRCRRGITAGAE